jgi:aminoglycoside 3'-phosphotransferase II
MKPLELILRAWRARLSKARVEEIRSGLSNASLFRVEGVSGEKQFLKIAQGDEAKALRQEIERTSWLRSQGINVPEILDVLTDAQMTALLMSAVNGIPADESLGTPSETISLVGRAMAQLHAVPVELCPFDERLGVRLTRAKTDVDLGVIDPEHFDERNRGVSPAHLLARLINTAPGYEDLVVVHGDATFANIILATSGPVGFVDCGRSGVADRYVDLSVIVWEIESNFGHEWVDSFFGAYGLGRTWDRLKVRYYADLYELF